MAKDKAMVQRGGVRARLLAALEFALGAYLVLVILQPIVFEQRFGLGSRVAGVSVSGKTAAEAETLVQSAWDGYYAQEVTVGGRPVLVSDLVTSLNAKESVEIALNDEEKDYFCLSKYLGQSHRVSLAYDDEGIRAVLLSLYDEVATAPIDAEIIDLDTGEVQKEQNGRRLLLSESHSMVYEGLAELASDISVKSASITPMLTATDARELVGSVRASLAQPIRVTGGIDEQISVDTLQSWLKITPVSAKTLVEQETYLPQVDDGYYYLDQSQIYVYVNNLAERLNRDASSVELDVADGEVFISTHSVTGRELNEVKAINDIEATVKTTHEITLELDEIKPELVDSDLAGMGITELIGEGWTDASGSPANRIHNYTVGASKFDGVLIKPDEEVSFNTILGPVDASTGYLPELVILADKTVPEYGGGLCQVSSTAFRAALNSGLPILERHAHAYPVSYYRPYGVDATIYLPTPDLRFKNDTGHYILIQTNVYRNRLYFDFYGTKKPVKITFSGNADAKGAVDVVEKVTPTITDKDVRGKGSFTAVFYRHIYDATGKLTDNDKFTSKYDSPDKYPH